MTGWIVRVGRMGDAGYTYVSHYGRTSPSRDMATTFYTYDEASRIAAQHTHGEAIPEYPILVGDNVIVLDPHTLGDTYTGVIAGMTTIYTNAYGDERKERFAYIVGLDAPILPRCFADPEEGPISYIVVLAHLVKEDVR